MKYPEPSAPGAEYKIGETVVFTGPLSIRGKQASAIAVIHGHGVEENVTTKTTVPVSGNYDGRSRREHRKTSKEKRAEELIAKGQPIRILQETDFMEMVSGKEESPD